MACLWMEESEKLCGGHRKQVRKSDDYRRVKNREKDGKNGKEEF